MPIFDQGYQHWDGALSGHAMRWLAVTQQGVRAQMKNRFARIIILLAWIPAGLLVFAMSVWGLFEQKSTLVMPLVEMIGLPPEIKAGPVAYRGPVWTLAYSYFFIVELFFAMLLVVLVGPNLISQDLRYNAIPLYFSRPLRRVDYFLGKLGVIGVFLSAVTILPALLAWVLGVGFSFDLGVIKDTFRVVAGAVGFGLVVVVSAGSLMLAISSLSRNSRNVALVWIGFWIVGNVTAGVIEGITLSTTWQEREARMAALQSGAVSELGEPSYRPWHLLFSYTQNLTRIQEMMLGVREARDEFLKLADAARNQTQQMQQMMMAQQRRGPLGGLFGRKPPPPPKPPELTPEQRMEKYFIVTYPWQWSAYVLLGLLGLSLWTLSTRVKSLDRLK